MSAERELLRRLVEWETGARNELLADLLNEARALLAAPEVETVWAEGVLSIFRLANGDWIVSRPEFPEAAGQVHVRIPVPAHLLTPPVLEGEVVSPEVKP